MRAFPTEHASPHRASAQPGSGAFPMHREPNAMRRDKDIGANNPGGDGGRTPTRPIRLARRPFTNPDGVIGHEALYWSARRCWKGVSRKFSAQKYSLNIIAETVKLHKALANGKYKESPTHIVRITYPKPRTALAITFRDRAYQRSLNDNALYPQMVRGFIGANMACQKGKGTTAARDYFKAMLHRAYIKYGTNRFQVLCGDIKGYYDNMVHAVTERLVAAKCDAWTAARTVATLEHQYRFHGAAGYNPGSQMVQIAGIAYLDPFDHFAKEVLRRKLYVRYMDDTRTIGAPDEDMEAVKQAMAANLAEVGLWFHADKTRIVRASDGVLFLGFIFRVTESGRVLVMRDPKTVKSLRRKFRRLAAKIRRGEVDAETIDESWQCARACMEEGNSARLLRNMDDFVNNLKGEIYAHTEIHA